MSNQSIVLRFVITVLIATILHAVACILVPPFEFAPTRAVCFFFAFVSGIIWFPILFAVLLLPLRVGLRRFLPDSTALTHAVVAVMILPAQLAGIPVKPYQHSYWCKWAFWLVFAFAVDVSFFWPFDGHRRAGLETKTT